MIKKILKKIESKRASKKPSDRFLVAAKDTAWEIVFLTDLISKKLVFDVKTSFRKLSNQGKLPDFLIIGVAKCGTTYLWDLLKQHPEVEMSPHFFGIRKRGGKLLLNVKEPDFFLKKEITERDIKYYKSLFNKNEKLQGDASPSYAKSGHKSMAEILPKAKLIILLRNPIDRAFSAFHHMKKYHTPWGPGIGYDERKSFSENIEEDISSGFKLGTIISDGFYIKHINSVLKYYPKENLKIIITEQMKENPQKVFSEVCEFLGIKNFNPKLDAEINVGKYIEKPGKEISEKLYKIYKNYNEELYKFIGFKIREWENQNF